MLPRSQFHPQKNYYGLPVSKQEYTSKISHDGRYLFTKKLYSKAFTTVAKRISHSNQQKCTWLRNPAGFQWIPFIWYFGIIWDDRNVSHLEKLAGCGLIIIIETSLMGNDSFSRRNYRIQGHSFPYHWITKAVIVICLVQQKILTNLHMLALSGPDLFQKFLWQANGHYPKLPMYNV